MGEVALLSIGYQRRWEENWRHTREIVTMLYNVNCGKKNLTKLPHELMPLPSDKKILKAKISGKEQVQNDLAEYFAKRGLQFKGF